MVRKFVMLVFVVFVMPLFFSQVKNDSESQVVAVLKKAVSSQYSDWDEAKKQIDLADRISENSNNNEVKARFWFKTAKR